MKNNLNVILRKINMATLITGSLQCSRQELDLGITLNGGQSFRWTKLIDDRFRGVFGSTVWTLWQVEDKLNYMVHGSSVENVLDHVKMLNDYFRFEVSLDENIKKWASTDSHFESVCNQVGAVRILDQDCVENLFSFICSSNNNISRISGMVEKLCKNFGEKICNIDNKDYFDFPSIEALCDSGIESVLRKEGFGYRAGYIHKSAQKLLELGGKEWLCNLSSTRGCNYEDAHKKLMKLPGVGPKVADCICLMSLGHLEAIPVDTHIFQVASDIYLPHLKLRKSFTTKMYQEINMYFRELWGPLAGWAQTVIFCVRISSKSDRKRRSSKTAERMEDKRKKKK